MGHVASLVRFVFLLVYLNPENFTLSSARIYVPRTTRPCIKVINLSHPRLCLAGLPDCDGSQYAVFCAPQVTIHFACMYAFRLISNPLVSPSTVPPSPFCLSRKTLAVFLLSLSNVSSVGTSPLHCLHLVVIFIRTLFL